MQWRCEYCGTENLATETCITCGAAAPSQSEAANSITPQSSDIFLLHADNAAYFEGSNSRPASLSNRGCSFCLLVLMLLLLIGIAMVGGAYIQYQEFLRLRQVGVVTDGQMIERRYSTSDDSTTYYLTYRFQAAEKTYTREQSVKKGRYNRFERGGHLEILYDPQNPHLSRIQGTNNPPTFFMLFGVGWMIVMLGVFAGFIHGYRQNNKLCKEGFIVYGQIEQIKGQKDSDGDLQITLEYRFISPQSGQTIRKKDKRQRNDLKDWPLPMPETPVAIMYLNDNHFSLL